jgi:translation initiation factor IF-3
VTNDAVDRSMVEAISQVGRALGIETIAEKVESMPMCSRSSSDLASTSPRATSSPTEAPICALLDERPYQRK